MKKKIIIGSIIVILVGGFTTTYILKNKGSSSAFSSGKVQNVSVKKIHKGDITSSVLANAVIEEVETREVYLDSPLKVKKVYAKKNQSVKAGEKVIEFDVEELNSQLKDLEINREILLLTLQKLKIVSTYKNFKVLEDSVQLAQNNVDSVNQNYEDAKKKYQESLEAYERIEISKAELDLVKKEVDDREASLSSAKISLSTAKENLNEAKKGNSQSVSSQRIDIETQSKNLEAMDFKITNLKKKIANIETYTISPIDGAISEMSAIEGSYAGNTGPIFKVTDQNNLQVRASVKEFDIKSIKVGQTVKLTGDAINKEDSVTGKVASISPVAIKNQKSASNETIVEVVISIDKTDVPLKAGLNVSAEILTVEKKGILIAEFEMMKEDKDSNKFVFLVDEKTNTMNEKKIKVGANSDMQAEVLDGLKEGDIVVVGPLPAFKDGDRVKIIEEVDGEVSK